MYKKILGISFILLFGSVGFCSELSDASTQLIKGFQNLESIQQLNVINRLSAIADNDGVVF